MPYVKRNAQGEIEAISQTEADGFDDHVSPDSLELSAFLQSMGHSGSSLSATDQDFVRVLEDVVELLIDKGVILFTDLPGSAQQKMLYRQRLRSKMGDNLDLLGDD
jgi:hypothetical protein